MVPGRVMNRLTEAIKVGAGEDRFGAPPLYFAGAHFHRKVSAQDTGGDLCIYETVRTSRGGPPLHYHRDQDEWFFVRKGEFLFQVGDTRCRLAAGDCVFAPRKVPHAFLNMGGEGILMIVYQPAGTMEQFLADASRLPATDPAPDAWLALCRVHGVEIVGPQLEAD
jgi:mannose-6-phosphate isomerase-like protein (cupin superfamily)